MNSHIPQSVLFIDGPISMKLIHR